MSISLFVIAMWIPTPRRIRRYRPNEAAKRYKEGFQKIQPAM